MPSELIDYKKCFSLAEYGGYLNCAAQGPLTKAASQAVLKGLKDKEHPHMMGLPYTTERTTNCRKAVSRLIECKPHQVALANSTSWGVNIIAQGFKFSPGDEILAFAGQFPSTIAPFEILSSKGVSLVKIPTSDYIFKMKDFTGHLSSKTKLVSLEWIHFYSGDRIPINEIVDVCHKRNIKVILDITQGLGNHPFSMKETGVDAVVCSGYKWLFSPYGSGFVAFSDEMRHGLQLSTANWMSIKDMFAGDFTRYEMDFPDDSSRFDVFAAMGFLNIDGFIASLNWLNEQNIGQNFNYVRGLIRQLNEELDPKLFKPHNTQGDDRQSLLAVFAHPQIHHEKLRAVLMQNGFAVTVRPGNVMRVSPNIYNDSKQISEFAKIANSCHR